MLSTDQFMDVALLYREGRSLREIAALTGHSRNTIRRVVREKAPSAFHTPPRPSRLDPFKDYLRGRFLEHGLSAVRLFAEVRSMGFTGSEVIVRRFIRSLRDSAHAKLTVRFETPPGEQAQADWAEVGRFTLPNGDPVRLYAFVMVLSFSRMLYVEFTRSMRVENLIRCHQNAFAAFGGWPRQILYDNMRQVVVGPDRINPRFRDFADHHGFAVRCHRPYRPRTKGKVERMVSYVKDNFLNARHFMGLDDLNAQGRAWLTTTANNRVHATTKERPCELLPKEGLTPLGAITPYQVVHCVERTVDAEALVRFENCLYSVPASFVGRRVTLDAGPGSIRIRAKDCIVAEHPRAKLAGTRTEKPEHVRERWQRSLAPLPRPPRTGCVVTFTDAVQTRPLSCYQDIVQI
jgi:transposase